MRALLLALLLLTSGAQAQTNLPACALRAEHAKILLDRFGEVPVWRGFTADARLVEVYGRPDLTTWTILVERPGLKGRVMCINGAGVLWTLVGSPLKGEPL